MPTEPAASGICATSRVLPFKRAEVFEAFADARLLARWWGPQGFSNTFQVCEFQPQGRWIFVMHGPDGSHYANESVFLETSPERVVIQHVCAPYFTLTVTLDDTVEGHTRLDWQQAFVDPQVAASIWHIIEPANEQNLDRLHHVLASRAN
ncbi:MAG: hypothetical protein RIQ60_2535 [Pseudomonadota bacterium]|jgi:uncharacterized protein YndB with AHSA1/START domain